VRCLENATRVGTVTGWSVIFFSDNDFPTVNDCLKYCIESDDLIHLKDRVDKMGIIFCYTGDKRKNPSWKDMQMVLLYSNNQKIVEKRDRIDILLWQSGTDDKYYQSTHRSSGRIGLIVAVYLSKLEVVYRNVVSKPLCITGGVNIGPITKEYMNDWEKCCNVSDEISSGIAATDYYLMTVTSTGNQYPVLPMFINQTEARHCVDTGRFTFKKIRYTNQTMFGFTVQQIRPLAANLHRELHQHLLDPSNSKTKQLRATLDSLLNRINQDSLLRYMNQSVHVFRGHYDDKRMENSAIFLILTLQSFLLTILDNNHKLYDYLSPFPISKKTITVTPFRDDIKSKIIAALKNFEVELDTGESRKRKRVLDPAPHPNPDPNPNPNPDPNSDPNPDLIRTHKRVKTSRFKTGTKVEAYWEDQTESCLYRGVVKKESEGGYLIKFDDGDECMVTKQNLRPMGSIELAAKVQVCLEKPHLSDRGFIGKSESTCTSDPNPQIWCSGYIVVGVDVEGSKYLLYKNNSCLQKKACLPSCNGTCEAIDSLYIRIQV